MGGGIIGRSEWENKEQEDGNGKMVNREDRNGRMRHRKIEMRVGNRGSEGNEDAIGGT